MNIIFVLVVLVEAVEQFTETAQNRWQVYPYVEGAIKCRSGRDVQELALGYDCSGTFIAYFLPPRELKEW